MKRLRRLSALSQFSCAGKVVACTGLINNLTVIYNASNIPSNPESCFSISALILSLSFSYILCSIFAMNRILHLSISQSLHLSCITFLFRHFQAIHTLKLHFPTSREYGERLSHEIKLMMIPRLLSKSFAFIATR